MAAGLGFKTFTTGEVLTAADTNGYLMQGVLVFASAAARDAAITSPQEGQFAYLADTNVTTYYTGAAWANLDTTGMTNPMTTTADMIYSSSGSTPARLGIGTVGQVLTVNSGATAPEWATPAGGGKVLQVVSTTYSTAFTTTSTSYVDSNLTLSITPSSATSKVLVIVAQVLGITSTGANGSAGAAVLRGASIIVQTNTRAPEYSTPAVNNSEINIPCSLVVLDSPATTSSTTYKTQIKSGFAGQTAKAQVGSSTSTITLLEIGA